MPLEEIKDKLTEIGSQPSPDQSSKENVDLQTLAVEIYKKLKRELEIEN